MLMRMLNQPASPHNLGPTDNLRSFVLSAELVVTEQLTLS